MNAYNQQQQNKNSMMGGLMGMGGTLGAAKILSDRRLKTNIKRIGQMANGLFIYLYNYIWGGDTQIGVMADEVKRIMPHAVITLPSGYDAVNYNEVLR